MLEMTILFSFSACPSSLSISSISPSVLCGKVVTLEVLVGLSKDSEFSILQRCYLIFLWC